MIQANELRITNFILDDGVVNAVIMIGIYSVQLATKQGNIIQAGLDLIEPISLTEEWLLKFGFKKINTTWYKLGNMAINISFDVEWGSKWMGIRLKYVHQLQNLYFAITGQELTLKDKQ